MILYIALGEREVTVSFEAGKRGAGLQKSCNAVFHGGEYTEKHR